MKKYLETLIEEKGGSLDNTIEVEGHFGMTYGHLIEFIETVPQYHMQIKRTLVAIDFQNGDVFHYLDHLAHGMAAAAEA